MGTVRSPFSAKVNLELHVNGEVLDVAQVGSDFLILREPRDFFGLDAVLYVFVDGTERRHEVFISHVTGKRVHLL